MMPHARGGWKSALLARIVQYGSLPYTVSYIVSCTYLSYRRIASIYGTKIAPDLVYLLLFRLDRLIGTTVWKPSHGNLLRPFLLHPRVEPTFRKISEVCKKCHHDDDRQPTLWNITSTCYRLDYDWGVNQK